MILLYNAGIYTGFKGSSVIYSLQISKDRILAPVLKDDPSSIAYPILLSLTDTGGNPQPVLVLSEHF